MNHRNNELLAMARELLTSDEGLMHRSRALPPALWRTLLEKELSSLKRGCFKDDSSSFYVSSLKRGCFKDNSSIFCVPSLKLADFKDERCMAAEVKVQLGKLHVIWRAAKPEQAINASSALIPAPLVRETA